MEKKFSNDNNTFKSIDASQKNNNKNEIIDINSIEQKPINEIKDQIININLVEDNKKSKDEFKKDSNKKYYIKFSYIIEDVRRDSDKEEKMNLLEFTINLLLMSSQINQTNKISCLTLLSYINFTRENALYTYYINKKIFKYLQTQKNIESFIYIRTLYRAAFFLKKEKNFFQARKYIGEAEDLSKNSKIDETSAKMLRDIKKSSESGIEEYLDVYMKKFSDIEKSNNLIDEKYLKMKQLFKALNENKYQINHDQNNNNDDNSYFYLINKSWFNKAYQFFLDYIKIRDNNISTNYFKIVFDINYCYQSYFDIFEELQKHNYKYSPFPCLIDNYSIINWTDILLDPLNEDENLILKKELKEGKDYFLLEEKDFKLFQDFFGVSNIIKRKKEHFVQFKAIILDKRLAEQDNNYILRKRNLQVSKKYTINELKEKIIRCINHNLYLVQKEKLILEKKGLERQKKEAILKSDTSKDEKIKELENKLKENYDGNKYNNNIDNYNIHFYLLEKKKKDILMEICISLINNLPKYESIFLHNINVSENNLVSNLVSSYDKKSYMLIIELQEKSSSLFINPILQINTKYSCAICKKEIHNLEKAYKCNICNYSLFCSEECANNDLIHEKLDKIFLEKYLYEEFNLNSFLKKDISNLTMLTPESQKGMVGLINLGNTCYINSTLQCLSNTVDLTKYFLMQYFRNDINTGNKLGSSGNIAFKYYKLLSNMWCNFENKIDPSEFVNAFKNLKKQFGGSRQQDAQEFLSVLLDQLHEDLNRITDKPYIELLEKQPNEDDLIASKRWWDLHKKREDSIIVDLFNGQFKSETICQKCGKSSITYDPFMSLCLSLPKTKTHFIFKIFIGIECKYLDFIYENKNITLLDLKKKAIDFISKEKKSTDFFDLEMVLLDENKTVEKIIQTDINDKKNYMGGIELNKILTTKNELIFFEKKLISNEEDYITIFVYPIEEQKPNKDYAYWNHPIPLKYLSYPLYYKIKNDTTVDDFNNKVFNRILSLHFFIEDKYNSFMKSQEYSKILDLKLIHSKDTKKDGFWAIFSIEDTCKFCNESNETNYYCSIEKWGSYKSTLKDFFKKVKKPVILAATSKCYNLSGEGKIYLECDLFTSNNLNSEKMLNKYTDSIILKDCLELLVKNENLQDDSWFCSNCKKLEKSKQRLQIYKPPNYLIILIKRYNYNKEIGQTFSGEKNNTFISYPTDNFDITEYIVGPEKNKAIYDLYGVIEHYGSLNQGHYTAICKNDGNWVSYNDSMIKIVDSPVSKNAYVLFYKMKDI